MEREFLLWSGVGRNGVGLGEGRCGVVLWVRCGEWVMPRRGFEKIGREEILAALKQYVEGRGEEVTMREFCRHVRVSPTTVLKRWGRWRDLRKAAGLMRPQACASVLFSDRFLIDEYRRICKELGRPPCEGEFNRLASCSWVTLYKRFGNMEAIRRRARLEDEFEEWNGGPRAPTGKPELAWDEAWLERLWRERLRVGFALFSSDLRGRVPEEFDVVFCAEHDWPGCPVAVLRAVELLGGRARETPVGDGGKGEG